MTPVAATVILFELPAENPKLSGPILYIPVSESPSKEYAGAAAVPLGSRIYGALNVVVESVGIVTPDVFTVILLLPPAVSPN